MAENSPIKSVLPKHYQTTLKNGLEVVVIPLKNQSNVITTNVFYKVGSRNETMGKSGIAHMLEHLNFKSTKNLKAGEFDRVIKGFGGSTNAATSFDYTHYYIKSSTQNLGKSLELFSELMQNLSLKDEEFQPERNVVAEEYISRNHDCRILRLIIKTMECANIFNAPSFNIFHKTNRSPMIRVIDKSCIKKSKIQITHRVIVCPP